MGERVGEDVFLMAKGLGLATPMPWDPPRPLLSSMPGLGEAEGVGTSSEKEKWSDLTKVWVPCHLTRWENAEF